MGSVYTVVARVRVRVRVRVRIKVRIRTRVKALCLQCRLHCSITIGVPFNNVNQFFARNIQYHHNLTTVNTYCFKAWLRWSTWSDCSRSCGTGERSRSRSCSTGNNRDCDGRSKGTKACNVQDCPSK